MTYRYRLLAGGYVDETGPHCGFPPNDEDIVRIELMFAGRILCSKGPIEFQVHDPLPQTTGDKQ